MRGHSCPGSNGSQNMTEECGVAVSAPPPLLCSFYFMNTFFFMREVVIAQVLLAR